MQEQQVQVREVKKVKKIPVIAYIIGAILLVAIIVAVVILVKPDMRERVGEPQNFSFKYDGKFYMHGKAENLSGKTIKYCTFEVIGYNAVDDKIASDIFKITGPIEPGELINFYLGKDSPMGGVWWSDMKGVKKVEIGIITLEYMDGTKETGYYGYSTEERRSW